MLTQHRSYGEGALKGKGRSVAVVGLGYVGLPTALALESSGARVLGIDISDHRLAVVRAGNPDLLPADRQRLARARHHPDRFRLTADLSLLRECDDIIVCVPTPVDDSQTPDLMALKTACAAVVAEARPGHAIVLTSTSYVGCTRDLVESPLRERGLTPGVDVHVAFAPERIDPGNSTFEQGVVPRVVAGATEACAARAADLLRCICVGVHAVSSLETAELAKLLENTYRAVNISLANEFSEIAHHVGVDPIEVITAAATKPFGFTPFYPGPGVGGHCIPCDPHYLLWQLRRDGRYPGVISAAMESISARPGYIVRRAAQALDEVGTTLSRARVLVAGLAYKPNVEDVRESPSRRIISVLAGRGATVAVYDPLVPAIEVDGTVYRSISGELTPESYDLVVLCTRHTAMDERLFRDAPLVLDACYALPAAPNRVMP